MTTAARTPTSELARALAAAAGLLLLLVGLPTLLIAAAIALDLPSLTWPAVDHAPAAPPALEQLHAWAVATWHTLRLTLGMSGLVVLGVLSLAWTAWGVLTWWTLVEIATQLRLVQHHARGRLAAAPRRYLAGVVATALMLTGPVAAHASPQTPSVATAPRQPGMAHEPPPRATADGRPEEPDSTESVRYTVQHGDTLWSIAERVLGAGRRYPEIVRLNTATLTSPNQLRPGEVLLLPVHAHTGATASDEPDALRAVVVKKGETLSSIAARELGDPQRWRTLFTLNAGRPQPGGLRLADPDILLPGWYLFIPTPSPPPTSEQPANPDDPSTHPQPPHEPTPTGNPADTQPRPPTGGIDVGSGVYLGLGLAAATSAALALARARHRRHHRPGHRAPPDLPVPPTVYRLRQAHLAATHGHPGPDEPAPDLSAATTEPASTPPTDALAPELGVDDTETVTLDLAATGGLGLSGAGAGSAARALLLALLTHDQPVTVTLTRADAEALVPDREQWPEAVHLVAGLDDALAAAEAELDHRLREPDTAWPPWVLAAHASPEDSERLHTVLQHGAAVNISALLRGQCHTGITVTVDPDGTVTDSTTAALQGMRLFTATEQAVADVLDLVTPAGDTHRDADENTQEPEPPPTEHLDEAPNDEDEVVDPGTATTNAEAPLLSGEDTAQHEHAPLELRILGPTTVTWHPGHGAPAQDLTPALTPRQKEVLVYLALHPDGVARDTLITDLWHDAPPNRPTNALNTTLTRLRTSITRATTGELADLIDNTDGRLRLGPGLFTVDNWRFHTAYQASRTATSSADRLARLQDAIDAYRGELGADIDTEWIQTPRYAALRTLVNAVGELARHLVDDNPQHTLDLLETARGFDPYNEDLYRDIMRLQDRLGAHEAIARTHTLLQTRLAEIDTEPSGETRTLATALQHRHRSTTRDR